jgi:hypothetical protein
VRFRTYAGASRGINDVMGAFASRGGNAYGDQMRDLAYVDSARSSAARDDSETGLNQQKYAARESLPSVLSEIPLPAGITPGAIASLYASSENPNLRDVTQGLGDLNSYEAQRGALGAAQRGDVMGVNLYGAAAQPGTGVEPFKQSESGVINSITGNHSWSPGHGALVNSRNAAAGASAAAGRASDAHAGLYQQQAMNERYRDVAPGYSVVQLGQQPAAQMPGIIGALPDGRPIVQNDDGSISTHRMATVTDPRLNGGRATNIPTMINGQTVMPEQALEAAVGGKGVDPYTGKPYASYDSVDDAEVDYALRQHPQIDREASWQQQQFQQRAGNRVVDTLQEVYRAPMTPQQMDAGSGGGADGTAKQQRYNELVAQGMPPRAAQAVVDGTLKPIGDANGLVKGYADVANQQTVSTIDDKGMLQLTDYGRQFYGQTAPAAAPAAAPAGVPPGAEIATNDKGDIMYRDPVTKQWVPAK